MGMQRFARVTVVGLTAVFFLLLSLVIVAPLVHAVDEPSAEAAEASAPEMSLEHMRAEIAAEEDPELRAAMEEQLDLIESGQLDLQTLERDITGGGAGGVVDAGGVDNGSVFHTFPDGSFFGPDGVVRGPDGVIRGGGRTAGNTIGGQTGGSSLPPEAQAELEKIFSQGTGDPSKDVHLREQAEKVMEKYGIERPTFGGGGDQDDGRIDGDWDPRGGWMEGVAGTADQPTSPRDAFQQWEQSEQGQGTDSATREQYREMSEQYQAEFEQRSEQGREMMEHMSPEAREQMEHHMEREFGGPTSEHSYEAPTHEYEAPTHEYEAPMGPGDGSGMGY